MIENLRKQALLSDGLLNGILWVLGVPSSANYHVLAESIPPDSIPVEGQALGLNQNGKVVVELLKFQSGNERVNAGYLPDNNLLILANVRKLPVLVWEISQDSEV